MLLMAGMLLQDAWLQGQNHVQMRGDWGSRTIAHWMPINHVQGSLIGACAYWPCQEAVQKHLIRTLGWLLI